MTARSRHQLAWPRLVEDLDWYYEERENPTIRGLLEGVEVRERDDDQGEVTALPSRTRGTPGDSPKLRKLGQIGAAIDRLPESQRRRLEQTWILRRQYHWWRAQGRNVKRGVARRVPRAMPEWCLLGLSAREIREMVEFFREHYRRSYRSKVVQTALAQLDESRRRGWGRSPSGQRRDVVGLASEGL